MKDISEYLNDTQSVEESVFDLDKNIESGPDWQKQLIDWLEELKHYREGEYPYMADCIDEE